MWSHNMFLGAHVLGRLTTAKTYGMPHMSMSVSQHSLGTCKCKEVYSNIVGVVVVLVLKDHCENCPASAHTAYEVSSMRVHE